MLCSYRSLKSRVKVLVDGTLLISRVTPEDSGNYTCTPTNGLLTPPSASAYLIVRREYGDRSPVCLTDLTYPLNASTRIYLEAAGVVTEKFPVKFRNAPCSSG